MKYEKAIRRQRACITALLILIMWGWGGLQSHVKQIKDSPEMGLLFLGGAFGIPIFILFVMSVYYYIQAKKAEYDELDSELEDENGSNNESDINSDN